MPLLMASMAPSSKPLGRRWTSSGCQRSGIRTPQSVSRLNELPWSPPTTRRVSRRKLGGEAGKPIARPMEA
jgi:hypothetical protein